MESAREYQKDIPTTRQAESEDIMNYSEFSAKLIDAQMKSNKAISDLVHKSILTLPASQSEWNIDEWKIFKSCMIEIIGLKTVGYIE